MGAAEKHSRQHSDVNETPGGECVPTCDASNTSGSASQCPRKKLRSMMCLPIVSSCPVLPALSIICKKVEKYITVTCNTHKGSAYTGSYVIRCVKKTSPSFTHTNNVLCVCVHAFCIYTHRYRQTSYNYRHSLKGLLQEAAR